MMQWRVLTRVRNMLLEPRREWPVAAAEPDSVRGVFARYVLVLAAMPAMAQFVRDSLLGYHLLGARIRLPLHAGLLNLAVGYVISLLLVLLAATLANLLAPSFGARASMVQAVKAVAYAWTAAWIGGLALLVPWLAWPVGLAGAIYSVYLLYLGLPHAMHCSEERSAGYAAVVVAVTMVLWALGGTLTGVLGTFGSGLLRGALEPQVTDAVHATVAQHPAP